MRKTVKTYLRTSSRIFISCCCNSVIVSAPSVRHSGRAPTHINTSFSKNNHPVFAVSRCLNATELRACDWLKVAAVFASVCVYQLNPPFFSFRTLRAWSCSSMFFWTINERNIWKSSVARTGWNTGWRTKIKTQATTFWVTVWNTGCWSAVTLFLFSVAQTGQEKVHSILIY